MRLNNDWLNIINAPFGQIDSFKIYGGALPASVGQAANLEITAVADGNTFNTAFPYEMSSIKMSPDGSKLYMYHYDGMQFLEYPLSVAYDLSSAGVPVSVVATNVDAQGMVFKPDGTQLFFLDAFSKEMRFMDLSVAWDLSTAVLNVTAWPYNIPLGTQRDLVMSPDGTKMFVLGGTNDTVKQCSLSTPWDITTITVDAATFTMTGAVGYDFKNFTITSDGLNMFLLDGANKVFHKVVLSTAWDISTAVDGGDSVSVPVTGTAFVFALSDDSTKLFVGDGGAIITGFDTSLFGSDPFLADLTAEFVADANNTFLPVIDGIGTKMVWQGVTVIGSATTAGDMAFFVMKCSDGLGTSFLVDGTVTATAGGGDIEFASVTVAPGSGLAIDGISFVFNDVFNT